MDARSEREWSSVAAARATCPNSLRRRCCISEETGGWLVCDRTDTITLVTLRYVTNTLACVTEQYNLVPAKRR